MEEIEEFIDKLEDNIRWWKRAMETDGFESDEEGSYRRDLENTKKELYTLIQQELDKAREEGARDVFTKDEWFMLKLAMNDIFNGGNRAYEDISNKIKSQLSKLSKKK